MILPKFTWNDGAAHTLSPSLPATKKVPVDKITADRNDDFTGDGVGQWSLNRQDRFRDMEFLLVPETELAQWEAFMLYATKGKVFTYYPDASDAGTHYDYTVEDKEWDPKLAEKGVSAATRYYTFSFTMRRYVP